MSINLYSLFSHSAVEDLEYVRDELDALADDEEDHDQDQDPRHARLAPTCLLASWLVLRGLLCSLKANW